MTGNILIWCSLVANICAIFTLSIGLKRKNSKIVRVGRTGILLAFVFCTLGVGVLVFALITNDFSFRYVAEVSSQNQPIIYRIAGLWGGMSGSLLFWLWLLTLFSAILVITNRTNRAEVLANHALLPLGVIQFFFNIIITGLISGVRSPFASIKGVVDGRGMNPLLQTLSMIFHPPTLYVGFIGLAVPFAFAIAALTFGQIQSDTKQEWYIQSRQWTVFSWLALTIGIVLGGVWAYGELGWGGYWSWDAVENVSLISWLLATAFLHTAIVQRHSSQLIRWNFISVFLVFESTIFGTFITRSGIISSVHAFAKSAVGYYFLGFILVSILAISVLMIYRRKELSLTRDVSDIKILSRTGILTITNWIFLAIAFVVFLGTVFPILSRIITGHEIRVSENYFNQVTSPFGVGLLLMIGLNLTLSQKNSYIKFSIFTALLATISVFTFLLIKDAEIFELKNLYLLICTFGLIFIVIITVLGIHRTVQKSSEYSDRNYLYSLINSVKQNKRRYAGYISHIGFAIAIISILGSKGYQKSYSNYLKQGESIQVNKYSLRFDRAFERDKPNVRLIGVEITVLNSGKVIDKLYPAMGLYKQKSSQSPTKEVAIRRGLLADLYAAFTGITENGAILLQVHYIPLVNMLWFGCILILVGGIVLFLNIF